MKELLVICLAHVVLLYCSPVFAACPFGTCRVSKAGTANNDATCGAQGDECATIAYAINSRAAAGDTILVEPGVYYERVSPTTDGTEDNFIVIEGEDGAIVDGSDAFSGSWTHVGENVYSTTDIPYEPRAFYWIDNGTIRDIPKCYINCVSGACPNTHWGDDDCTADQTPFACCSGLQVGTCTKTASCMEVPSDGKDIHSAGVMVNFWDGIGAMHHYSGGTTYLRFGDDNNVETIPDAKLRTSPGTSTGAVFHFLDDNYFTLRNLEIRGGWRGVAVGNGASNIIIEDCTIYATGREKVYTEYATNIIIQNNVMYRSGMDDFTFGPHDDGTQNGTTAYGYAIAEHLYSSYKYYLSNSASSSNEDQGISPSSGGIGIEVYGNKVHDTSTGLSLIGTHGVVAHNNEFYNCQQGFYMDEDSSVDLYENYVHDNNISMRFGRVDLASATAGANIFNNRFYNPDGTGNHTYFHYTTSSGGNPSNFVDLNFYHNSFVGGFRAIQPSGYADDRGGLQDSKMINNVFSSPQLYGNGGSGFWETATMIGVFNYNWVGGSYLYNTPANPSWGINDGEGNVFAEDECIWGVGGGTSCTYSAAPVDFVLPTGHAARAYGIDVSQMFTLGGTPYPALPGIDSGYFPGVAPNMGAVQDDSAPPAPPKNLRVE